MTSRPQTLDEDWLVLRRPHFCESGRQLFFLISKRPSLSLSGEELEVWQALDGERTISALHGQFGERVDATLTRFMENQLCETAPYRWPTGRRRVLVFEPHSDDAALSVGASMWQRRHDCEFTVVTMGGRSNFTSYYYLLRDYFDPEEVSALRAAEGRLFTRLLGGHYVALPQNEAPLRYQDGRWTLEWFKTHRVSIAAFTNHHSSESELHEWKAAARTMLADHPVEEVWLPLGIGVHTDHELTRDAVLDALIEDPDLAKTSTIKLYQDVPYAAQWPKHGPAILDSLRLAGAIVQPEQVPIDDTFARKLELVSLFASQFKIGALRHDIEQSARNAAGGRGGKAELLFELVKRPAVRKSLEMYFDLQVVRSAEGQFFRWTRTPHRTKRIRLLLLMPAGRYREDMELLLRVFPNASIDVYVTHASAPEAEAFLSPRIHLHHVSRGARAWTMLAVKLAFQRPGLTLFLAGTKTAQGTWLAKLWPMAPTIVIPSLDHFMRGFRVALVRSGEPI